MPSYLLSDRRLRRGARPTPSATEQYGTSRRYDGTKRRRAADARPVRSCRRGARRRPCSTEVSFDAQRSLAYRSIAIVVPSGPTFVSSRIRPASDRETSRIVVNGWSNPSAGQGPDRCIAAGSEPGLENNLKVETRIRTPLGLRGKTAGHRSNSDSDQPDARRPGVARFLQIPHRVAPRSGPERAALESEPHIKGRRVVPVTTYFASPRLLCRSSRPPPRKSMWLDK